MVERVLIRCAVALAVLVALVGVRPAAAFAAPSNDDFANATTISSLPFSTAQATKAATADPSDPQGCHANRSVWFAFTPDRDMLIRATTAGSGYSTVLSAWTGARGALTQQACNYDYDDGRDRINSRITFPATAGTTYYLLVVAYFDDEVGRLKLSVDEATAPANDNFADATTIGRVPFSYLAALDAASMEAGEPTASCGPMRKTVWFSYTPTVTRSLTASMNYWGGVVVHTGTSLTDLTPIGCSSRLTFRAEAGTTYHFQVTESGCCTAEPSNGKVGFDLAVAPDPVADFVVRTPNPTVHDVVSFGNLSADPGRTGPMSYLWEFGDGTTSTSYEPTHQYAADGDYPVKLTATTVDGRTASKTVVVAVRTPA
ncbi:PKD domain-containing protein [Micromonospora sp. WMMD882]|uniref:PKD domain-containing protein n=1 Tax=Micromonospora sp. WMMD882 TaxID=3015151 RepID=UPI00248C4305|nr:PKD domain-containing protein [Micromonospora sp. WMMD882]WBB78784.1 PKD domain-containing protein [Micromonospora sp. WMMD882]